MELVFSNRLIFTKTEVHVNRKKWSLPYFLNFLLSGSWKVTTNRKWPHIKSPWLPNNISEQHIQTCSSSYTWEKALLRSFLYFRLIEQKCLLRKKKKFDNELWPHPYFLRRWKNRWQHSFETLASENTPKKCLSKKWRWHKDSTSVPPRLIQYLHIFS